MSKKKYGFVYIWRDRKHRKFYIGSHWGHIDDGYICSSFWMKRAHKLRPQDFKRRILSTNLSSIKEQFEKEQEWLALIKPEEIKVRYYNLNTTVGHWSIYPESLKTVREKIKHKRQFQVITDEHKRNISLGLKGKTLGRKLTDDHCKALSEAHKGKPSARKGIKLPPEQVLAHSQKMKELWAQGHFKNSAKGHPHTDEHKAKMKTSISALRWIFNPVTRERRRINKQSTIPDGWIPGRGGSFY